MQWDDNYKIAVDFIDDQHKEWFDKVADFNAAIDQKQVSSEIAHTLKFLVDYSQKHLADEEAYMREIGYPHLDQQIRHHKIFMQHVVGVLTDLKNGKDILPAKLHNFMATWIRQHIMEHDRQIGQFVEKQKAKRNTEEEHPPEHPVVALQKKLKDLSALVKADLITVDDFAAKKKELLSQLVSGDTGLDDNALLVANEKLAMLQKRGLLETDDLTSVRMQLAKRLDLNNVLSRYETPKQKMGALKGLLDDSLITTEQFEKSKTDILRNI